MYLFSLIMDSKNWSDVKTYTGIFSGQVMQGEDGVCGIHNLIIDKFTSLASHLSFVKYRKLVDFPIILIEYDIRCVGGCASNPYQAQTMTRLTALSVSTLSEK